MSVNNNFAHLDNKSIPPSSSFYSYYYEECTTEALTDELLKSFLSSKKNSRFYYAQAEYFIRRINIYDPLPIFVLHTEDIPDGLTSELQSLDSVVRDRIITNVVRRIYESVDSDYFHVNGIYGRVKWFMLETEEK